MIVLYIVLIVISIVWIIGFFISNDLSVQNGSVQNFKNILIVYPHPDDETLASGGLTRNFFDQKSNVTLIVLTKGEKGNDDAHLDNTLKSVREEELRHATKHLGITHTFQEDFGDGELTKKKRELTVYLEKKIRELHPDCILTYDLAGLYGHDDHIVTSEILTDLVAKKFKRVTLLYPSLPKNTLKLITLPEHMAKNPAYATRRVTPNMKIWIGRNIFYRIFALYSYKSQLYSFRKSFPIQWIPLWYYYSMQVFEYYHRVI